MVKRRIWVFVFTLILVAALSILIMELLHPAPEEGAYRGARLVAQDRPQCLYGGLLCKNMSFSRLPICTAARAVCVRVKRNSGTSRIWKRCACIRPQYKKRNSMPA